MTSCCLLPQEAPQGWRLQAGFRAWQPLVTFPKPQLAANQPVPSDCLVASDTRELYLLPRRVLHKDPPPQFSFMPSLHSCKASFQRFLLTPLLLYLLFQVAEEAFPVTHTKEWSPVASAHGGKKSITIFLTVQNSLSQHRAEAEQHDWLLHMLLPAQGREQVLFIGSSC